MWHRHRRDLEQNSTTHFQFNKKPTKWLGQAKRRATKIWPKAVGGGIFAAKCQLEVAGHVISIVAEVAV